MVSTSKLDKPANSKVSGSKSRIGRPKRASAKKQNTKRDEKPGLVTLRDALPAETLAKLAKMARKRA